jgi:AraC-like DNA-binding protein
MHGQHYNGNFYKQQLELVAQQRGLPEYLYVQVRHSKHFMEQYYSHKIELEKIAAAAFMSRFHYIRMFQQVYGVTPRQYLRDLRISKAKELLQQGHEVSTVCIEVGYDSLTTFSNTFKRGTGHSPTAYRELNKSNRE